MICRGAAFRSACNNSGGQPVRGGSRITADCRASNRPSRRGKRSSVRPARNCPLVRPCAAAFCRAALIAATSTSTPTNSSTISAISTLKNPTPQ